MKLLSFRHEGTPGWGAVIDDTVIDLRRVGADEQPTLRTALAALSLQGLEERLARAVAEAPRFALDRIEYLPVIPDPGQIFCVGLNYDEHRIEAQRATTAFPTIFLRVPASQVGHGQPLLRPPESERFDYEGEIAIVIGRGGRRIAEADAWAHIAGYAPYNDGSLRDWQAHTTQWTAGKNFAATGGFGPWMVTRGEIADGQRLELVTRLNGRELQRGHTDQLIFPIPRLLAYISSFTPLAPGDVIVTGTPAGVGFKRTPPVFMAPGDRVEVEVSGVGTLVNPVLADAG